MGYLQVLQVMSIINVFSILFAIMLNTSVIVVYFKMSKSMKEKSPNIYLASQAFANYSTIVMAIILEFSYLHIAATWVHLLPYYEFTFIYSSFVTIGTIVLTTIDRYSAIRFPFKFLRHVTSCRVFLAIFIVWIVSSVPPFTYGKFVVDHASEVKATAVTFAILLVLVLFIFITLVMTYSAIRDSMQARLSVITVQESKNNELQLQKERQKERRILKILFCMAMTYAVTMLPIIIVVLMSLHYEQLQLDSLTMAQCQLVTSWVYTLSSITDPLLTIFIKEDFSRAKDWFRCRCREKSRDHSASLINKTESNPISKLQNLGL